MAVPALTANSPSTGFIAWTAFGITYGGVSRNIAAGNTAHTYVYWLWNSGNPASTLVYSDTVPQLTADDLLLFVNRGGIPINVQSTSVIDGSLIATGSIVGSSVAANTISGTNIAADTLTARNIQAGAVTASSLSTSSIGAAVVVNGDMDDPDPVTFVPAGWTKNYVNGGTPATYGANTTTPLSGKTSVTVTEAANSLEGMASRATPVKGGDSIMFGTAFRTSVTGVPITLRAYFGTTDNFAANAVVAAAPDTATNIYIYDVSSTGMAIRSDIPTPLAGGGISAVLDGWLSPVTTTLYVTGQITAPSTARFVRFVLASGLTSGSPANTTTWDALVYAPVVTGVTIASGAITAEHIAARSITANELSVGALDASVITGATFQTSDAGSGQDRIIIDSSGIDARDAANDPVFSLPTNPGQIATFKGQIHAQGLTVDSDMQIRGTTNNLGVGSVTTLANQLTNSGMGPVVSIGWQYYPFSDWLMDNRWSGTYDAPENQFYVGWDFYGKQVATFMADGTPGTNPGGPLGVSDSNERMAHGLTKIPGGNIYTCGNKVGAAGTWIMQYDHATGAKVSEWQFNTGEITWASIGNDGTNLMIAFTDNSTFQLRVYKLHPTTYAQVGSTMIAQWATLAAMQAAGVANKPFNSVMQGSFDFGGNRVVIGTRCAQGQVFTFTVTGASSNVLTLQPNETFPLPDEPMNAVFWDSTASLFRSMSSNQPNLVQHTPVTWTTESSRWWVSSSYYRTTGAYETPQSPRVSFTMKRRAYLTVIAPALPVTGGSYDPDAAKVYFGRHLTVDPGLPPATGMFNPFGVPIAGAGIYTVTTLPFNGPNPPLANTFPSSAPAVIKSAAVRADGAPAWQMGGDGVIAGSVPVGTVTMFAGTAAPAGYLLCDGSSLLRASYPDLFAVIGIVFGNVDGTHFTLPNYTGKFPTHGVPGGSGGSNTHTHPLSAAAWAMIGAVGNTIRNTQKTVTAVASTYSAAATVTSNTAGSVAATVLGGATDAGNNLPPFLTVNFIIKF